MAWLRVFQKTFTVIVLGLLTIQVLGSVEWGSWRWTLFAVLYEVLLAYVLAWIIVAVGQIMGFG